MCTNQDQSLNLNVNSNSNNRKTPLTSIGCRKIIIVCGGCGCRLELSTIIQQVELRLSWQNNTPASASVDLICASYASQCTMRDESMIDSAATTSLIFHTAREVHQFPPTSCCCSFSFCLMGLPGARSLQVKSQLKST